MSKLPYGKIPVKVLKEVVFRHLGVKRGEVAVGPSAGIDGTVIDVGDKSIVVSTDPITGALERIGWLVVNVNANDIATFGVQPEFFFSCILLPEGSSEKTVETLCSQMDRAARSLNMALAGGHSEVTPGLDNPIIVGYAMGVTEKGRYVTASSAKTDDKLILTKSAGIEGTAILATDREKQLESAVDSAVLNSAKEFFSQVSIVKEALLAFKTGRVHGMHDPTEGGVLGGIHEMADASNVGVKVYEDRVRVAEETRQICSFFRIDPLQLISSGALLIAADPEHVEDMVDTLHQKRIQASIIGEFTDTPTKRTLVKKTGARVKLPRPASDHLWKALANC